MTDADPQRPTRFVAIPQPLLHELYGLGSDCALVALRLIECAAWKPTTIDEIPLDIGECLVSQRSNRLWGDLGTRPTVPPRGPSGRRATNPLAELRESTRIVHGTASA